MYNVVLRVPFWKSSLSGCSPDTFLLSADQNNLSVRHTNISTTLTFCSRLEFCWSRLRPLNCCYCCCGTTEEHEPSSSLHCLTFHNSPKTGSTLSDFSTIAAHSVPAVQPTHASPTDLQEQGVFLFMCWTFLPSMILCNPFLSRGFGFIWKTLKQSLHLLHIFQFSTCKHNMKPPREKQANTVDPDCSQQNQSRTLLDRY